MGLMGSATGRTIDWPSFKPANDSRFSPSVFPVTVMQFAVRCSPSASSIFITAGVPPTVCRSSMDELSARFQVGQVGDPVADGLEVVDRQIDIDGACHGDQMQHGVGRATE